MATESQDMMQMQQDAVRRVMEMQRQANARLHPSDPPVLEKATDPAEQKPPSPAPPAGEIAGTAGLNSEQLLLLALAFLLYREGADRRLLLALLYLLL